MGAVDVKQTSEHELTLEWDSSASNDMIADSTLALITGIDKSPASVKRKSLVLSSPSFPISSRWFVLRYSDDESPQPLACAETLASTRRFGRRHR